MNKTELIPQYDTAKSFYGKAIISLENTGEYTLYSTLYSYGTRVCSICLHEGVITARVYGTYSPTTLRHIKEFLKQNGFKAETKKQILSDYGV